MPAPPHLHIEEVGDLGVAEVGGQRLHRELDDRRRAHQDDPEVVAKSAREGSIHPDVYTLART